MMPATAIYCTQWPLAKKKKHTKPKPKVVFDDYQHVPRINASAVAAAVVVVMASGGAMARSQHTLQRHGQTAGGLDPLESSGRVPAAKMPKNRWCAAHLSRRIT